MQIARQSGCGARPDFDARAVGGVGHTDVVDVNVLHVIDFADVLAETADANAVAAVAHEVLNDDIGAVGLEGDAVVAVVDVGVLDYDVVGAVGVPAIARLTSDFEEAIMRMLTHQYSWLGSCLRFLP